MSEKPALVTGVPGWLGSKLVESLISGLPEVKGLESPAPRLVRALALPAADTAEMEKQFSGQGATLEVVRGDLAKEDNNENG
ncbi:MAG TPA: hypothetical protein PKN86_21350, partial [Candidatus Obscuribacter sp.]|nr:hypothetical protein [Candidatus Obscuribacter sp.]